MRPRLTESIFFAMNVATALYGTLVFEPVIARFHRHPIDVAAWMRYDDAANAITAFLLGLAVFFVWKTPSAKWVWIVGLCLFAWKAIDVWFLHAAVREFSGRPRTMFWEFSSGAPWQVQDMMENWGYTLDLIRTTAYSAGALVSSQFILGRAQASRPAHGSPDDPSRASDSLRD